MWAVPLVGIGVALVAMIITSAVAHSFARVGRANPAMATELMSRLIALQADKNAYCGDPQDSAATAACAATASYVEYIAARLTPAAGEPAGHEWASGSGYIGLWTAMHRAEEAMMLVAPPDVVVAHAAYDQSRLRGSNIAGHRQMVTMSKDAVVALAGEPADQGLATPVGSSPSLSQSAARGILAGIRRVVNDYRDGLAGGLVQLRRRLNTSVTFIGLTAYVGVALAMMSGLGLSHVLAGSALYLTGVLIGLLQVAYTERNLQSQVNDYGVSTARMIHVALISGLAGFAGAILAALLTIPPFGLALLQPGRNPDILQALNLQTYPAGLVVAAIFGLTPGLLLKKLRDAGNSMTIDLESSSSGGGTDDQGDDDP